MIRYSKWIVLVLLFLCGNEAFSSAPLQGNIQLGNSLEFHSQASIGQHSSADFPSHGYAMLILRYNDDSKDKIFSTMLTAKPLMPCIGVIKPLVYQGIAHSGYSPYFPEKMLRYEAFLYSLPLRSPPACC